VSVDLKSLVSETRRDNNLLIIMKEQEKKNLTMMLLMQTIAGARNVKPMERLEALHKDVGLIILGKKPYHSKDLIHRTF
tara:strand:- start:17 stop:253 length:237 start_codon:yes stop_codon:yes gene_type:complete